MLLDDAGYGGPRVLRAVAQDASPEECARLGASLAAGGTRTALLAVGDGSARRNMRAPGHFDERAEPFDASVERALAAGDMTAIARLDAGLARELMATGRAAWQVLAGALGSTRPGATGPGEILYADAPFGVAYLVAVL
jgi:aromatic ring-opening dioxygenase LigB subunit